MLEDPWFAETPNQFNSIEDIEESLTIYYSKLRKLEEKYTKKLKPPKNKTNSWWTIDLEIERKSEQ